MLTAVGTPLRAGTNAPLGALDLAASGITYIFSQPFNPIGVPGVSIGSNSNQIGAATYMNRHQADTLGVATRWRASKGSAPVGRFTRSFGDNATEGWHRSMPVSIEVTAGTTATVAALFILGASSTAEARATASAAGAFVLALASVAQGVATASTTGTLTAGATSTAEARATATAAGTLSLGAAIIAEARATASAGATFVLGIASTAGRALVEGLVTAALTLRHAVTAVLTRRAAVDNAITHRPAVQTELTARDAVETTLAYQSDDPVP